MITASWADTQYKCRNCNQLENLSKSTPCHKQVTEASWTDKVQGNKSCWETSHDAS